MGSRWWWGALFSVAAALCPSWACGQGPTQQEVQTWFDKEWAEAQKMPALEGFGIRWRQEDHAMLPPQELEALRQAVKGHPEHPRKNELIGYEQKLKSGPIAIPQELYVLGDGKWRYNSTFEDGSFFDAVVTPERSWTLFPQSLAIYDVKAEMVAGTKQSLRDQEQIFRGPVGEMLFGGFYQFAHTAAVPGLVVVEGDRWKVDAVQPPRPDGRTWFALEYRGRWDAAAGRGFVERATITAHGYMPGAVGSYREFKEWFFDENIGRWIARRVEERTASGELALANVFEKSVAWPAGGFEALTAIPPARGSDPIRGESRFTSMTDFRERAIVADPGTPGEIRTSLPAGEFGAESDVLRTAGWLVLGVLVVVFGFVYFRRRSV